MNITKNKKANFEFHLEKPLEAGLKLEGWEVKAIRQGKVNIAEAHIFIKGEEVFVSNMHINPLVSTATHNPINPTRIRKLLLNKHEITKMIGLINQKGFTCVPVSLHWNKNKVKMDIALAKGKKLHDKRADLKEKAVARDSARQLKF